MPYLICKPADVAAKLQQLHRLPGSRDSYTDEQNDEQWTLANCESATLGKIAVLKLAEPAPVGRLVDMCLTAKSMYDIAGAACELRRQEQEGYVDFREQLMLQLQNLDTASLPDFEKARIKVIITDTRLHDPANQRDPVGKPHTEVIQDASFHRSIAEQARAILEQIG